MTNEALSWIKLGEMVAQDIKDRMNMAKLCNKLTQVIGYIATGVYLLH